MHPFEQFVDMNIGINNQSQIPFTHIKKGFKKLGVGQI